MQVFTHGKIPVYKQLEKWERSLLHDPLVDVIKDFYKQPQNRQAFEKWLADGKPMTDKNIEQENISNEQIKMAI